MKGYVHKKKDGRWEGRVELPKGPDGKRKQKYVYADKRAECQRKVNEIIYKIETSDFADPGKLTVSAYMESWIKVYKERLAKSTQQGYENYVNNHIKTYFDNYKMRDLKPIYIEEFYNSERKKFSENTVLHVHRILSLALRDAVRNNLLAKNPCDLLTAPSPKEKELIIPGLDVYFSIVEKSTGTEHELPVLLAGLCGLRREEVFGLTWNDIDFDSATLTVRQVVTTANKKLDIKEPKTKLSARTISIPADVLETLKGKKAVGFICSKDGNVTHPGNYSHRFSKFLENNQLPHIRFHDLRHFHATLLMEAGVPLKHIQSRLGHSTMAMAAHYQHILTKADITVIEKMDTHINQKRNNILEGQLEGQSKK